LGGDQGRVEARGNAIIVIITKQASGTANIDRLMLAFNTIAVPVPQRAARPKCILEPL
jgi:hypothetical protein